jgi:hypothetical protein
VLLDATQSPSGGFSPEELRQSISAFVNQVLNTEGIEIDEAVRRDWRQNLGAAVNKWLGSVVAVAVVCLVALIDFAVFRNMNKLANYLNPSRLAVTEAVFGVLLAALAVELMVRGLAAMGVIGAIPLRLWCGLFRFRHTKRGAVQDLRTAPLLGDAQLDRMRRC